MARPTQRAQGIRALVVAAVIAALLGLAAGWMVRAWSDRSPESRARERAREVQEQVREHAR